MPQVLKSRKDGFSSLIQQESLDGLEGTVSSEEKVDKAGRKHLRTAANAKPVLTLKFFKHLHGLLENYTLYTLEHDNLFE